MSLPARYLRDKGLIKNKILDYGSGRGKDAMELGADCYDPTFAPDPPTEKYDTILCTYVLNVVSKATEHKVVEKVRGLLAEGGRAYFTVRRDVPIEGTVSQRYVRMSMPILRETSTHCIYVLEA